MSEFMIINADPREWPDWEERVSKTEKDVVREAYCAGEYDDYFNTQNCSQEQFNQRLKVLAYIWE